MKAHLPPTWTYVLSRAGRDMHIAILFDRARVQLKETVEITVPPEKVQGKDIFDRDPLAVHVALLDPAGVAQNDLIVVGLHLASQQTLRANHDRAMDVLRSRLNEARANGLLGGTQEQDILLMGDLNASMFNQPHEAFFDQMRRDDAPFRVLADDDYPVTRLSGTPLAFRNSRIDYIIASRRAGPWTGLLGEELTVTRATVHAELVGAVGGPDALRETYSDHLPVTVDVAVTQDTD